MEPPEAGQNCPVNGNSNARPALMTNSNRCFPSLMSVIHSAQLPAHPGVSTRRLLEYSALHAEVPAVFWAPGQPHTETHLSDNLHPQKKRPCHLKNINASLQRTLTRARAHTHTHTQTPSPVCLFQTRRVSEGWIEWERTGPSLSLILPSFRRAKLLPGQRQSPPTPAGPRSPTPLAPERARARSPPPAG